MKKKEYFVTVVITPQGVERTQIYGDKGGGLKLLSLIERQVNQMDRIIKKKGEGR